jgi:hypothetical protein
MAFGEALATPWAPLMTPATMVVGNTSLDRSATSVVVENTAPGCCCTMRCVTTGAWGTVGSHAASARVIDIIIIVINVFGVMSVRVC